MEKDKNTWLHSNIGYKTESNKGTNNLIDADNSYGEHQGTGRLGGGWRG